MNDPPKVVYALIMAGGDATAEMQSAMKVIDRSAIPFRDKPMVQWVVDALKNTNSISKCVLVGRPAESEPDILVTDQGSFVGNLFGGLEGCADADYVLIATADAPFLTPEALESFVTQSIATGADLTYAVVPVNLCYKRFPGIKRTAVKIRDGQLTGGNVALVKPAVLLPLKERISEAYAARKSPLKLVGMLGWGVALRAVVAMTLFPKLIGIRELEAAVCRLLSCKATAIISEYPELATDIDRLSDIEALNAIDMA